MRFTGGCSVGAPGMQACLRWVGCSIAEQKEMFAYETTCATLPCMHARLCSMRVHLQKAVQRSHCLLNRSVSRNACLLC